MDAAALFERHHAELVRYLVRLTGDPDVADDAAQETFARLLARKPREERLRAWLFMVATNLVREWSNARTGEDDAASAEILGDPDDAELLITPGALRIRNRASATASYRITLPPGVRTVTVREPGVGRASTVAREPDREIRIPLVRR